MVTASDGKSSVVEFLSNDECDIELYIDSTATAGVQTHDTSDDRRENNL